MPDDRIPTKPTTSNVLMDFMGTVSLRLSLRGLLLLVTAAVVACWLLFVQPWREERFRPYAEYKHELNSRELRLELWAGEGQSTIGRYIRKSGNRWCCLAIGATRWNFEAGPDDCTYSYGTLEHQSDFILLKEHWKCDDVPDRVIVVSWGPRKYLLREDELESFKEAVEAGEEPRQTLEGNFFMMHGDQSKPTSSRPNLPP